MSDGARLNQSPSYEGWPWRWLIVSAGLIGAYALLHWRFCWGWNELGVVGTVAAALVGLAALFFTNRSLRLTRATIEEMAAAREAQSRPIVVAYFERRGRDLYVCIANAGNGPAATVTVKFDPPLLNSEKEDIGESPLLGEVIPLLLPGPDRPMATFFDDADRYMGLTFHWGTGDARSDFTATMTYTDPLTLKPYTGTSVLDLAHLATRRRLYPYATREELESKLAQQVRADITAALQSRGIPSHGGTFEVRDLLAAFRNRGWHASVAPQEGGGFVAEADLRLADGEVGTYDQEGETEAEALAGLLFIAVTFDDAARYGEEIARRADAEEAAKAAETLGVLAPPDA